MLRKCIVSLGLCWMRRGNYFRRIFALIILIPIFFGVNFRIRLSCKLSTSEVAGLSRRMMRLLRASDTDPVIAETTLVSCKVITQNNLGKKEVAGLGITYALLDGDFYRGITNKQASLEVSW